jgi:3-isopropylmalate/(R)-2-methylmalate dehydratase large subunit
MAGKLFFEKVWDAHRVLDLGDGFDLVHIDRHMMHELTGNDGFAFLTASGHTLRNPKLTFGTPDHVVSTEAGRDDNSLPEYANLITGLRENARTHAFTLFDLSDRRQGIVHVVAPEQGIALPGATLVCGDSHTCTVGGVGALAWGIGTSEVHHVMATQTLVQLRPKTLRVHFDGELSKDVSSKDMILFLIGQLGTAGGDGHAVEYAGSAVTALSVEARLSLCNLSIELGARMGFVAPDETTFAYLEGRPFAPRGAEWERALSHWQTLPSDPDAQADREVTIAAPEIRPQITWGTSPEQVVAIDGAIPDLTSAKSEDQRSAWERALDYMGLEAGTPIAGTPIDVVFIGSCTNSRLSDLELAAEVARGRRVAPGVRAVVVPGSGEVKHAAEVAGIADILRGAGFEWREPGCSMCVGMNDDKVAPGQRSVSTSNRNFEGRQGPGARTHLASPATAAASAIAGTICGASDLGTRS